MMLIFLPDGLHQCGFKINMSGHDTQGLEQMKEYFYSMYLLLLLRCRMLTYLEQFTIVITDPLYHVHMIRGCLLHGFVV